jgi:hypothetical protein
VLEEPLLHETNDANAINMMGAARTGSRLRLRTQSNVDPSSVPANSNDQVGGIVPGGKLVGGMALAVPAAVVPTLTVSVCVPLPVICTEELDRVQVGAGATTGVIAQVKFTVPVNDPVGAMATLKLAV